MSDYAGSCLCGGVRFKLEGEFEGFFLCHCRHCRKDTGSAHAANLFSRGARLTWLAGESGVGTFTLPGTRHVKSFCRVCGSALPVVQMNGALTVVPAGCLDGDPALRPTAHIFMASKAGWDSALDELPAYPGLPGGVE